MGKCFGLVAAVGSRVCKGDGLEAPGHRVYLTWKSPPTVLHFECISSTSVLHPLFLVLRERLFTSRSAPHRSTPLRSKVASDSHSALCCGRLFAPVLHTQNGESDRFGIDISKVDRRVLFGPVKECLRFQFSTTASVTTAK